MPRLKRSSLWTRSFNFSPANAKGQHDFPKGSVLSPVQIAWAPVAHESCVGLVDALYVSNSRLKTNTEVVVRLRVFQAPIYGCSHIVPGSPGSSEEAVAAKVKVK